MSMLFRRARAVVLVQCLLAAVCFLATSPVAALPVPDNQQKSLKIVELVNFQHQHIFCTAAYSRSDCAWQAAALRRILERYNAEDIGEWSWILVRKNEWKPLLQDLGLKSLTPAITSFVNRETFFDESLFSGEADRVRELTRQFGVPPSQLLPLAVTHELGHAACKDFNEDRAERYAELLRRGYMPGCSTLPIPLARSFGR